MTSKYASKSKSRTHRLCIEIHSLLNPNVFLYLLTFFAIHAKNDSFECPLIYPSSTVTTSNDMVNDMVTTSNDIVVRMAASLKTLQRSRLPKKRTNLIAKIPLQKRRCCFILVV